jgi:hypothetical protein
MATLRVLVVQGYQEDPQEQELRQILSCSEIPASDEEHQWVIWKEITAGYENSGEWKVDRRYHGYVSFQHAAFHALRTVVYTTLY